MVLERLEGMDFDHFGLECSMFLIHYGLSLEGINFFFGISTAGKFVALVKCLSKWKPFLVSSGHILKSCTDL